MQVFQIQIKMLSHKHNVNMHHVVNVAMMHIHAHTRYNKDYSMC